MSVAKPASKSVMEHVKNDPVAKAILGAVLGLGFASLFRQTCKDGSCIIVRGPSLDEVNAHVYKIEDTCYKYVPKASKCL